MELRRSADSRINLALKEHVRLDHEIAELESQNTPDPQLAASLRMCRAHIERELRNRGWQLVRGAWRRAAAA